MTSRRDRQVLSRLTEEALAEAIGPIDTYAAQCHAASIAVVKSGLFETARVARGSAVGVGGQHSWVHLGTDVYSLTDKVLDVTMWSYVPERPRLLSGNLRTGWWRPKGWGSIWAYGVPYSGGGEEILLDLPPAGAEFQRMLQAQVGAPLDLRFWSGLFDGPMQGWPAKQFVEAALDHPTLRALVPIDVAGMLTDRNPGGLYLPGEEKAA